MFMIVAPSTERFLPGSFTPTLYVPLAWTDLIHSVLTFYRNRYRDGKMALFSCCCNMLIKQRAKHYCPPTWCSTGFSDLAHLPNYS